MIKLTFKMSSLNSERNIVVQCMSSRTSSGWIRMLFISVVHCVYCSRYRISSNTCVC